MFCLKTEKCLFRPNLGKNTESARSGPILSAHMWEYKASLWE